MRSPSVIHPWLSLAKAAESGATVVNLSPAPFLPKCFVPERVVLEELVA
jgi:hypothetical protein